MMKFRLFLLVCLIASLTQLAGQTTPLGYRSDNSDWWSLLRTDDANENIAVQERAPTSPNFKILDIDLGDDALSKASAELGKASVIERGDASSGRRQICYSSVRNDPGIHLIFESGEVSDSFYLFEGGPDWSGSNLCVKSNLVAVTISVASGLHLGQTAAEVKAILGKPSAVRGNKIMYSYSVQIKTPPADFEKLRKQHPELNLDELQRDYEFYSLSAYIEARFTQSKLTYLAVSKTETY